MRAPPHSVIKAMTYHLLITYLRQGSERYARAQKEAVTQSPTGC